MSERWSVLDDEQPLSGGEVSELLAARVERGQLTTYLQSEAGRLLIFVSNGTRAMVVLMDREGDPGEHAASPGTVGSTGGYLLETGQEDTYDDADTVPLDDAITAVRAIVDTGRPSREQQWMVDR